MKIVISGGTGFLGTPLTSTLLAEGHAVVILSRSATARAAPGAHVVAWTPEQDPGPWSAAIDGADVVINLAGEPIDKRWTEDNRRRFHESLERRFNITALVGLPTGGG